MKKNNGYQTSRNSCNSSGARGTVCCASIGVPCGYNPATAQDSNTTVTPPGIPTLTTTGFMMKANMHLTDLTGVNSTTNYQYVDLKIATDVAGAVVGHLTFIPLMI